MGSIQYPESSDQCATADRDSQARETSDLAGEHCTALHRPSGGDSRFQEFLQAQEPQLQGQETFSTCRAEGGGRRQEGGGRRDL